MKPTRSAPASTAASTSSWRVRPQTLTSGRAISSASFAPGSAARISVEPTSIAFGAGELGRGALGARLDRGLGDRRSGRAAPRRAARAGGARSISNVERSRALTPITGAPSAVARASSSASCASTSVSSPSAAASRMSRRQASSSRSRRMSSAASAPASAAVRRCVRRARRSPSRAAAATSPRARRAGRPSVPANRVVDEHRHRPRAGSPRRRGATATTSPPGRRSPAEGERRLNSAIAPNPGAAEGVGEPQARPSARGRPNARCCWHRDSGPFRRRHGRFRSRLVTVPRRKL